MTATTTPQRAVFLDRDGTILDEVGYLNHISRYRLYAYAAGAIRRLNQAGWRVVIVTNQSGVGRGYFPESLVLETHSKLGRDLQAAGAHVTAMYYCPHTKEQDCGCRKPRTGMIDRAVAEHGLTTAGSWVVGDREADVSLAHNAGCRGILLLSGYGRGDYEYNHARWQHQPEFVAEDLAAAVGIILRESA